jgi:hypothetical protein
MTEGNSLLFAGTPITHREAVYGSRIALWSFAAHSKETGYE